MSAPQARILADGRLHLHHGPIDLIIAASGQRDEVAAAGQAAQTRFATVLDELVDELPDLRRPVDKGQRFDGAVARRMGAAVARFAPIFVTPMAAVAGAVADEILAVMIAAGDLDTAYVNNGGDIALHVRPGASLRIGLVDDAMPGACHGGLIAEIAGHDAIGAIATSGAGGRSFSLGIADAVTVLADDAVSADAAATLIANAVNVDSPAITRAPANTLDPDSDLGERPVTVAVGALSPGEIEAALGHGLERAHTFLNAGLIRAGVLSLAGACVFAGDPVQLKLENGLNPDEDKAA